MSEIENSLKSDTQTLGSSLKTTQRDIGSNENNTHTWVDPKESPESHRDS